MFGTEVWAIVHSAAGRVLYETLYKIVCVDLNGLESKAKASVNEERAVLILIIIPCESY